MMEFKDPMVRDAILLQIKKVEQEGNDKSSMGFRFDIGDETVRIFNKPGRKLITCTCANGTRFCNEPCICKHKVAAFMEWIKLNNQQEI